MKGVVLWYSKGTSGAGFTCKDSATNREKKMNNMHTRLIEDGS
jgi:hypothetical protein